MIGLRVYGRPVRDVALSIFLCLLMSSVYLIQLQLVSAQSTPMRKGVNVHYLNDSLATQISRDAFVWVRTEVSFDSQFSNMYRLAQKYGLQIIGILDDMTMGSKPFTLADWTKSVRKAQSQFKSIHVWEIWNEPTIYQLSYMDGTPERYTDLLKSAYSVLKSGDRNCVVLGLGGVRLYDSGDLGFSKQVFALGAGAYMDAISLHAYAKKLNLGWVWSDYESLWTQQLQQFRQLGKAFWITETGFNYNQLNEKDQSDFLSLSYRFFMNNGAVAYVWYQLIDYRGSEINGLISANMTQRRAYVLLAGLR